MLRRAISVLGKARIADLFTMVRHPIVEYCRVLLHWRSAIIYSSCLFGWILYECISLEALQVTLGAVVANILAFRGHHAYAYGTDLVVDGCWTIITKECTYMDLFLVTAPLVLRGGRFLDNCLRVYVYLITILSVDVVRLVVGKRLQLAGVPRTINHDLINYVLWYGTAIITFSLWLRAKTLNVPKTQTGRNDK